MLAKAAAVDSWREQPGQGTHRFGTAASMRQLEFAMWLCC